MSRRDKTPSELEIYSTPARDAVVAIERSLVGACVRGGPEALRRAVDAGVVVEDIAHPPSRHAFSALLSLADRGAESWDVPLIASECLALGTLEAIGGAPMLQTIVEDGIGGISVAAAYASQVRDEASSRRMVGMLDAIRASAVARAKPTSVAIQEAVEVLIELGRTVVDDVPIADRAAILEGIVDRIGRPPEGSIPLGMPRLDELLRGGARPGQLILVAARPGMGKSAFALQVASNVADTGIGVAFFSMEMSDTEVMERELAQKSGMPMDAWIHRDNGARLMRAHDDVLARPIHLIDRSGIPIGTLATMIRRLVERDGVGLVVVDYIGLIQAGARYRGDRNNEISEISATLKALASELKVPIIALSQLNRGVEARPDKRPNLSDLRDSGALEQDANVVIMLYRAEYYLRDACPANKRGICDVMVQKNRGGQCDIIPTKFDPPTMRFVEVSEYED